MPFTTELDLLHIEKRLTLLIVLIIISSVLNKDQNHYYIQTKMFLKDNDKKFSDSIIMLSFGKIKVTKEKFYGAKNQYLACLT